MINQGLIVDSPFLELVEKKLCLYSTPSGEIHDFLINPKAQLSGGCFNKNEG
jgi:hypothetical protein